jgi:hypothetical protein
MSIEEVKTWQIDLEISLLTTITMLNQHGVPYENIIDMIEISVKNCLSKYDKNRDLLTTVFKKLEKENKEITEISINESNINNNEIITKINECEYDKFPLNCISRDYLEKDDIMLCFILHKEIRKSRL